MTEQLLLGSHTVPTSAIPSVSQVVAPQRSWRQAGHIGSQRVTTGHNGSHRVTTGHIGSQRVTSGHIGSHRTSGSPTCCTRL
ncbi:hypothetical protein EYF80_035903 [Liparis tanakae]|uniref:Uncharacterized protein n=1 Tax=Liparis tanakae TaxID=230148 RepID=A0A4Z2GMF1_9TELE|nr:hypothetical protein EYF80_035903 [Liparis tanakae]